MTTFTVFLLPSIALNEGGPRIEHIFQSFIELNAELNDESAYAMICVKTTDDFLNDRSNQGLGNSIRLTWHSSVPEYQSVWQKSLVDCIRPDNMIFTFPNVAQLCLHLLSIASTHKPNAQLIDLQVVYLFENIMDVWETLKMELNYCLLNARLPRAFCSIKLWSISGKEAVPKKRNFHLKNLNLEYHEISVFGSSKEEIVFRTVQSMLVLQRFAHIRCFYTNNQVSDLVAYPNINHITNISAGLVFAKSLNPADFLQLKPIYSCHCFSLAPFSTVPLLFAVNPNPIELQSSQDPLKPIKSKLVVIHKRMNTHNQMVSTHMTVCEEDLPRRLGANSFLMGNTANSNPNSTFSTVINVIKSIMLQYEVNTDMSKKLIDLVDQIVKTSLNNDSSFFHMISDDYTRRMMHHQFMEEIVEFAKKLSWMSNEHESLFKTILVKEQYHKVNYRLNLPPHGKIIHEAPKQENMITKKVPSQPPSSRMYKPYLQVSTKQDGSVKIPSKLMSFKADSSVQIVDDKSREFDGRKPGFRPASWKSPFSDDRKSWEKVGSGMAMVEF